MTEGWEVKGIVRLKHAIVPVAANDIQQRRQAWDQFTLLSWNEQYASVRDANGKRLLLRLADLEYLGLGDSNELKGFNT